MRNENKPRALINITIAVEYDPTLTNPEALCASIDSVVNNPDVHAENGCGNDVEIKSVRAGAEPAFFTSVERAKPSRWEQQVGDVRVEALQKVREACGVDPLVDTYKDDQLIDQVLGITNDQMWALIDDLGIDDDGTEVIMTDDAMALLVDEIELLYVNLGDE